MTTRDAPEPHSEELDSFPPMLSRPELAAILHNTVWGRGGSWVSREELDRIIGWAREARLDSILLDLVLGARLFAQWTDNTPDITFRAASPEETERCIQSIHP